MCSLSHARLARRVCGGLLVLLLSGCSAMETMPGSATEANKVEPTYKQELKALFAQPYIDPLTDYLKQHRQDRGRRAALGQVAGERDRRCDRIARRYEQHAKTAEVLARYQAGYSYSCPRQVQAFAAQVRPVRSTAPIARATERVEPRSEAAETDLPVMSELSEETVEQRESEAVNECYLLEQIHNYADAIAACQAPAQGGDMKAQRALGNSLLALQRYDDARHWLLMAARQQDAQAQIRLAEMALKGQAGEADPAQAWAWYRQAGADAQAAGLEADLSLLQKRLALHQIRQQLDIGR